MKTKLAITALILAAFSFGVYAAGSVQEIKAQLRPDITVVIDSKTQSFSDANGNIVYPILYNGTTYLPIRAIGNIMGKEVGWDDSTKTVTLGKKAVSTDTGSITIGQKNALESAKKYLSVTAFSYTGLIKQLEYEKYSTEDATYAADNCGADWFEQAAKSAKNYLNIMSFSRDGLIKQLEYEGFTHEQAVYGAEANGY